MFTRRIGYCESERQRQQRVFGSNASQFFSEFWRNPSQVAALLPTSAHLAAHMVEKAGTRGAKLVVELGAGNGAITRHIVRNLPQDGRLIAVEINPVLANTLKREFPSVIVVNDKAENIRSHLSKFGIETFDVIIATLPWYWLDKRARALLLNFIYRSLTPQGTFITCMHLQSFVTLKNREFCREVNKAFPDFQASNIVWRNVMPAVVLTARKQH